MSFKPSIKLLLGVRPREVTEDMREALRAVRADPPCQTTVI